MPTVRYKIENVLYKCISFTIMFCHLKVNVFCILIAILLIKQASPKQAPGYSVTKDSKTTPVFRFEIVPDVEINNGDACFEWVLFPGLFLK